MREIRTPPSPATVENEFDIAIIGVACRFPGARSLGEFWQNLAAGTESITHFSDEELLRSGVAPSLLRNPNYVKAAPLLDEPGFFDAAFFGFSPAEAKAMDPQHRILLELAHDALEDAGCNPDSHSGRIGVFTGCAMNTYFINSGMSQHFAEDYIPTLVVNDKDFLSTRISYKLNLKGPSITIQTACSTSLVAVHLARQSLLSGETDLALVGAISVRVPHRVGYFCDSGGVVSPDGCVRAFDADANGTVFGSGGGIIVLKRLADAIAGDDTIHAIIKGSAVNNDGSEKAGYTAPSVNSQADAVVEALANAAIDAADISYVEAHGSGTPVGDPIEIAALTQAFRTFTSRSGYCAIGSVKTNIGHLDAAAGIAGMIKTILALKYRQLPPTLNYHRPNPEIDFSASPFYVNTTLIPWTSNGPRRAGVMSTGMGGTNAHVVLEEAPDFIETTGSGLPHLLPLSAKSDAALESTTNELRNFLQGNGEVKIENAAYTLQTGRKAFTHRRYLVCADCEDAIGILEQNKSKRLVSSRVDETTRRPVILLLPGIGDHYVGMAHGLYRRLELFRQEVDRCAAILERDLAVDIRTIIYPDNLGHQKGSQAGGIDLKKMLDRNDDGLDDPGKRKLDQTIYAQPALFTIEYALARFWQHLGITPEAIVGHSMGEYVAACLADVFSLEDALHLVARRAKLVNALPEASMLAVLLPEVELLPLLNPGVSISLINGPNLCVVAGLAPAVAELEQALNKKSIIARPVRNMHGFHSRMIDPVIPAFTDVVNKIQLREPKIPFISNVTGKWITKAQATDPGYWASHAIETARFSDALHQLWQVKDPVLLEAGPGQTLSVLATQHPGRRNTNNPVAISSLRYHYENQGDLDFLWNSIGRLWLSGAEIRWETLQSGERRRKVPLPTYPFERRNYWMEGKVAKQPVHSPPRFIRSDVDSWFYIPTWQRTPYPTTNQNESSKQQPLWLIFGDRYGGGRNLRLSLARLRISTRFVDFGQQFVRRADGSCDLNPGSLDDYLKLFADLKGEAVSSVNVIHLGSIRSNNKQLAASHKAYNQDFAFYSLLHIAQAIGEVNLSIPITIGIISKGIHEVTGNERLDPEMATVLGPCGVIPREFANIECFNVDLPDHEKVEDLSDNIVGAILSEFGRPCHGQVVAYRGKYRWERKYEPVELPENEATRLRRRGVYLITGGTGGIGLAIAGYLAQTCQARLILTKKHPFPAKSAWQNLLSAGDTPSNMRETIRTLLEIEAMGAQVEVLVADSVDNEQMQEALNSVTTKFGQINGVIHAAGIVRAGVIQAKTREAAEGVLAPKINGTLILFELLKHTNLDFLVLFSSITSFTTPYAECDYCAANSFLDAFAYYASAETGLHTLTINWPGWKEVGQLAKLKTLPGVESWKEAALEKAITTKDGLEAFTRALNSDLKQIIISPDNLDDLITESRAPFDPTSYLVPPRPGREIARRSNKLVHVDKAPTNQVERALVEIWSNIFGFDQISIHEHFGDLGGHSLLAMQIVSRIRSLYKIGFTLREFFEAPTIAQLSSAIEARVLAEVESLTNDEARQLVSRS